MTLLYDRRIAVTVAGLTITEPRISFELDRQIDKTQDKGAVALYNLRPEHAQRIYDRGGALQIVAGYPGTAATVFDGQAQRVTRAREHLAHVTRIKLGDLVRSKERLGATFAASYAGPVRVTQIVRDIVRAIGLPAGPLDAIPPPATVTDWYWGGAAADVALEVLLRRVGCSWYEHDGIIRINRVGTTQVDGPTIRVTPEDGPDRHSDPDRRRGRGTNVPQSAGRARVRARHRIPEPGRVVEGRRRAARGGQLDGTVRNVHGPAGAVIGGAILCP